jgi:hypothetical protein
MGNKTFLRDKMATIIEITDEEFEEYSKKG